MIYTDYFVQGTEPTTICPLHPSNASIVGEASAGAGGDAGGDAARAAAGDAVGTAGGAAPRTRAQPSAAEPETDSASGLPKVAAVPGQPSGAEKGKKKRGFWGRVFGRDGG
jgi:hypothetical protein